MSEDATSYLVVPHDFGMWAKAIPEDIRRKMSMYHLRWFWENRSTARAHGRREGIEECMQVVESMAGGEVRGTRYIVEELQSLLTPAPKESEEEIGKRMADLEEGCCVTAGSPGWVPPQRKEEPDGQ